MIEAFRRLFAEHGLFQAIRSDNGLPFASPNGLYNLSKLSVFWLRLGIAIERIKPGHPQQNGRHERMHLTLKKEATRPPERNLLQQQVRFDAFVSEFNGERPYEAIGMKVPCRSLYRLSAALPWPAGDRVSLSRSRHHHHQLRARLPLSQEDQHIDRASRTETGIKGGRRRHLARQLHAL